MGQINVEDWTYTSAEAAEIVDEFSETELANYIKRYDPFPHKVSGRGRPIYFVLQDLLHLAAAGFLIKKARMPPSTAFAMLRPYGSPYGLMLHDGADFTRYPGTSLYSPNPDGRWVGKDGPHQPLAIEIRAWPLFDKIFPRMKKVMISSAGSDKAAELKTAIAEFEQKIKAFRKERWKDR